MRETLIAGVVLGAIIIYAIVGAKIYQRSWGWLWEGHERRFVRRIIVAFLMAFVLLLGTAMVRVTCFP